jgi:hypothetical protein
MCARYSLTKEEITMIIGEIEVVIKIQARYNIAPKQRAPVILEVAGQLKTREMEWGWQPVWSKSLLINGYAETPSPRPCEHRPAIPRPRRTGAMPRPTRPEQGGDGRAGVDSAVFSAAKRFVLILSVSPFPRLCPSVK